MQYLSGEANSHKIYGRIEKRLRNVRIIDAKGDQQVEDAKQKARVDQPVIEAFGKKFNNRNSPLVKFNWIHLHPQTYVLHNIVENARYDPILVGVQSKE